VTKWNSTPNQVDWSLKRCVTRGRGGPQPHNECATALMTGSLTGPPPPGSIARSGSGGRPEPDRARAGLPRSARPHAGQLNQEDATLRHRVAGRTEPTSPDRNRCPHDHRRSRVPVAAAMPLSRPRRLCRARSTAYRRYGALTQICRSAGAANRARGVANFAGDVRTLTNERRGTRVRRLLPGRMRDAADSPDPGSTCCVLVQAMART
jgi:hypothetical protein